MKVVLIKVAIPDDWQIEDTHIVSLSLENSKEKPENYYEKFKDLPHPVIMPPDGPVDYEKMLNLKMLSGGNDGKD